MAVKGMQLEIQYRNANPELENFTFSTVFSFIFAFIFLRI
jgi:hypothetical protein